MALASGNVHQFEVGFHLFVGLAVAQVAAHFDNMQRGQLVGLYSPGSSTNVAGLITSMTLAKATQPAAPTRQTPC
jgi:hypothetical protein